MVTFDYLLYDYKYVYKTRIDDCNGNERWFFVFDNDENEFIRMLHKMDLFSEYQEKEKGNYIQQTLDLWNT